MGNQRLTVTGERREATRYLIRAPLDLDDGVGTLCNLSTAGVLFRTSRQLALGQRIRFCWSVEDAGVVADRVSFLGTVVRVEQCGVEWCVAASIQSVSFNPMDPGEREARSGGDWSTHLRRARTQRDRKSVVVALAGFCRSGGEVERQALRKGF
jgi:hypothetical protein